MQRSLYDVLNYFSVANVPATAKEVKLTDLVSDTRKLQPGAIFYAHKGAHVDGRKFIGEAIAKGAALILLQREQADEATLQACQKVPVALFSKVDEVGKFASYFFDYPSLKLRLLGVTGTNGKTTITFLMAQLLQAFDKKCYILGTLGYGFLGHLHKSPNTTLEPIELQRHLAQAVAEGARYAVMEVSSIGVVEGRVSGCTFFGGVFTNLTRDHLDYHHTMENYAAAKEQFLRMVPPRHLVINAEDEYGHKWLQQFGESIYYAREGVKSIMADKRGLIATQLQYHKNGTSLYLASNMGRYEVNLPLMGAFNVSNYLAALSLLHVIGLPFNELIRASANLKPVVGRMERFSAPDGAAPLCIVDYAHTPDGVEQALKAAREHMELNAPLICVLGCGGDRDSGKRPIMARKAAVYADKVFITSDNPRTEDPQRIIDEMLLGVSMASEKISVIVDRKEAIAAAVAYGRAHAHSVVLVAGKGHEDYQILKDKTIHFSDREEVCALLGLPQPAGLYAESNAVEGA